MRRAVAGLLMVFALAACATARQPDSQPPVAPPMDVDGDGLVSEAELARAAATAFAGLDANRDGFLDRGEYQDRSTGADANGDGQLSFAETMARRLDELAAADRDRDGALSAVELAKVGPGLPAGTAPAASSTPRPADPAVRRELAYARLSAVGEADLQRRIHAQQLFEQWKRQAGTPVEAASTADRGEAEARVASAQRMLMATGYYAGPSDGLLGPTTRAAVARFQAEQGLPPTGDVDPLLLDRLRSAL
jgi:hypothetical protein